MNEYLEANALYLLKGCAYSRIPDNDLEEIIVAFSNALTDAISEFAGRNNLDSSDEPVKIHIDRALENVEINILSCKQFYRFSAKEGV